MQNLATELSEEHKAQVLGFSNYRVAVVFRQVASTGAYKVLRMIDNDSLSGPYVQVCEVFTLDGKIEAPWRGKKASPVTTYC